MPYLPTPQPELLLVVLGLSQIHRGLPVDAVFGLDFGLELGGCVLLVAVVFGRLLPGVLLRALALLGSAQGYRA